MLNKIRVRARARAFVGAAAVGSAMTFILGAAYVAGAKARVLDEAAFEAVSVATAAAAPVPPLGGAMAAEFRQVAIQQLAGGRLVKPAAPFRGKAQGRDFECLATAVYYEARGEGDRGQQAVAQVILNRVRHPAFPKTVCGVVYQGCQFSFVCDGSMRRGKEKAAWTRARTIAAKALAGAVMDDVGGSTFFHARRVAPDWVGLVRVASVGSHIFYRSGGRAMSGSRRVRQAPPDDVAPVEVAELSTGERLAVSITQLAAAGADQPPLPLNFGQPVGSAQSNEVAAAPPAPASPPEATGSNLPSATLPTAF